jgi:hypothetical protein
MTTRSTAFKPFSVKTATGEEIKLTRGRATETISTSNYIWHVKFADIRKSVKANAGWVGISRDEQQGLPPTAIWARFGSEEVIDILKKYGYKTPHWIGCKSFTKRNFNKILRAARAL